MLHTGSEFLRRSVLLRDVRLGEVADVLLDWSGGHVLGFAVLCGDGGRRMLPLAAVDADASRDSVDVSSALVLMEDSFYRGRGRALTELIDAGVRRGAVTIGTLADIRFDETGRVRLLDVDGLGELPAGGDVAIEPETRAGAD